MKASKIIPLLSVVALALGVVLWLMLPLPEDASAFASTTNIVFTARVPPLVPVPGKPRNPGCALS
jgi:hypothetical protein